MKAVILAGGRGTRISEESHLRPKPMIEIGGRPILWHIMSMYGRYGVNDFVVALGYRGEMIKQYFADYALHSSDITVDTRRGDILYHRNYAEPWRVTLVDTGQDTMTGGRLKRLAHYLRSDDCFCMTYGDGVADVDIAEPRREIHRKAARRQRLYQWRLLRAQPGRDRSHRRRRNPVGA